VILVLRKAATENNKSKNFQKYMRKVIYSGILEICFKGGDQSK
jgi:hypothetical protein